MQTKYSIADNCELSTSTVLSKNKGFELRSPSVEVDQGKTGENKESSKTKQELFQHISSQSPNKS